FEVAQGEYVSIIGPNGAGKSTLLRCLNRLVKLQHGQITLFGKELAEYSQKELGCLIGYVPQIREQVFPYTVYEFVLMSRYPYLKPLTPIRKDDYQAVEQALILTEMTAFSQRRVNQLSGGEKQRVYLAASLAQNPKVLLLDEPTTHLDPKHKTDIERLIAEICNSLRMTILHVTHDLTHIDLWSHKVAAFKDGKLLAYDKPSAILNGKQLKKIFDSEFLLLNNPGMNNQIIVPKV
ncbi:MAG: ABC transporter ATP-binding protein, partial [Candidatus Omnitrophica bacterium]|nr:ABC transporter ATP-binding protein [Candidatus Omnitrophota bacterium]